MFRMKSAMSILIICFITLSLGIGTYVIESMIHDREKTIQFLESRIKEEKNRISILEADWSYLTRPSRIQKLSQEMLSFGPIEAQRILTLDMLEDDGKAIRTETDNGLYQITIIEGVE